MQAKQDISPDVFWAAEVTDSQAVLSADDARHCMQVLRHKPGDDISAVDGKGLYVAGHITEAAKDRVVLKIESKHAGWGEPKLETQLIIAPPKHRESLEWLLEKAVELGVTAVWPVRSVRTERTEVNAERLNKIMVAALKQCHRSRLPVLHPLLHLHEALERVPMQGHSAFIAYMGASAAIEHSQATIATSPSIYLIGPEGDFTPAEVQHATDRGFVGVHLGTNRLRTETAALYMLALNKGYKANM